jgi:hypothetical protein
MADAEVWLPEFTRALRAFGSRRGRTGSRGAGADQQARFFAPLVDARREAASANREADVVSAFDPRTLGEAMRASLDQFAATRYPEYPAARRALEAQLSEVAEPLFTALDGVAAARARVTDANAADELRDWAAAVQRLFGVADRVWLALDDVLERAARTDFVPPTQNSSSRRRRGSP